MVHSRGWCLAHGPIAAASAGGLVARYIEKIGQDDGGLLLLCQETLASSIFGVFIWIGGGSPTHTQKVMKVVPDGCVCVCAYLQSCRLLLLCPLLVFAFPVRRRLAALEFIGIAPTSRNPLVPMSTPTPLHHRRRRALEAGSTQPTANEAGLGSLLLARSCTPTPTRKCRHHLVPSELIPLVWHRELPRPGIAHSRATFHWLSEMPR